MKTIVLASNNQHKIKEFKKILNNYQILSLKDIGYDIEIEETGNTFEENALIKARTIKEYLNKMNKDYIVISDDSGLCVDSLDGKPGIYSARYSGIHGDNQANRNKLLNDLKYKRNRNAHFICTIVVLYDNDNYEIFEGRTEGTITKKEIGSKEFGYDCLFYSKDLNKTFGEASEDEKNSVSHRGRAIAKMSKKLKKISTLY